MTIELLFFELIQVAIGSRICLSHTPTADEWGELYAMAKKQSLVGVCFAGVQKLQSQRQEPPEMVYLTWMGMAAKIQQRNEIMNDYTQKSLVYFRAKGFPCQVLKGQGIAKLYGALAGLRQSGDVDVWLDISRKEIYALSQKELGNVEGITYHHIHYPIFDDCEVEAHLHPSFLSSPRRNKALKAFCKLHKPVEGCNETPNLAFNRVYILLHCYRHFCGHGIGLRQLLDYYFVLVRGISEAEKVEANMWIERMGMTKFCRATMWLMQYVFSMDSKYLICEPDEKNGRFLLEEVMQSGNFGHGDERNKISGSAVRRYLYNIKRDIRTMRVCPHESLWDPVFNVYQFLMTKFIWNKL